MSRPPTLRDMLLLRASAEGDRLAYADPGRAVTFGELLTRASALAARFADRGVEARDRVVLVLGSDVAYAEALWATQLLGAVPCTLNPAVPPELLEQRIARIRPRLVVTAGPARGRAGRRGPAAGPGHRAGRPRVPPDHVGDVGRAARGDGAPPQRDRLPRRGPGEHHAGRRDGVVGPAVARPRPRGLRARARWRTARRATSSRPPSGRSRCGSRPSAGCAARSRARRTSATGWRRGWSIPPPSTCGRCATRRRAPSRCGPRPSRRSRARFGVPQVSAPGYGLAENTLGVSGHPGGRPLVVDERGHVGNGRPLPGVEVRIDGDADAPGEILVRGEYVFAGYFEAPDDTAAVLRDGWLHTGDVGYAGPARGPLHPRPPPGDDQARRGRRRAARARGRGARRRGRPRGRGGRAARGRRA